MSISRAVLSPTDRFRADVLAGLSRPQKQLPAKYFYDAAGSRLFERITELDEYYPTRTELAILRANCRDIATRCGPCCLLIEPGAGNLAKVRILLNALERPAGYVPVDVSGEQLESAARKLSAEHPDLDVSPVVADFSRSFIVPSIPAAKRVVFFPGSTIGNFDPAEADSLLRRFARLASPAGGVLVGADLRKDVAVLERAYNDRLGVTAAFNRNILLHINRELGADFEPGAFQHRSFFNREQSRIEMHLVSTRDQLVRVCDRAFTFRAGESIHTENSYKYDVDELTRRAAQCGLRTEQVWMDANNYFAVIYFSVLNRRQNGATP
jgi:dimethylhistidine N-methyltransferase